MAIERTDFENLGEEDLRELLQAQTPEGLYVEFKRDNYGGADGDRREFLKDVSAFANSHGGHLIVGADCGNEGLTAMDGVPGLNPDAETLRLEQLIRAGIDPRLINAKVKAVRLANGNHVLVVRVVRSWNGPHRVSAQNWNRFWIRNSMGVHEASMEELRALFTESASALDRVREFRDRRIESIAQGQQPRPLVAGGRLILHVVPLAAVRAFPAQLDLEAVSRAHQSFRPIGGAGMNPRFNFEGFINERGGAENHGYTQVFRNGALEATKAGLVREGDNGRLIPGLATERDLFQALPLYLDGLRAVGIAPPLIVMLTLEGVAGVAYAIRHGIFDDPDPVLDRPVIKLPECVINEYGDALSYHRAVRPALDALWNAIGYPSSRYFNDAGLWVGEQRAG